jgi:hypothetical protein
MIRLDLTKQKHSTLLVVNFKALLPVFPVKFASNCPFMKRVEDSGSKAPQRRLGSLLKTLTPIRRLKEIETEHDDLL